MNRTLRNWKLSFDYMQIIQIGAYISS